MNRYMVAAIWIAAIAGPWSLVAWLAGLGPMATTSIAIFSTFVALFMCGACMVSKRADEGEQYDPHR